MKKLLLIFTLLTLLGIISCNISSKSGKKQILNYIPNNKLHEIGISATPDTLNNKLHKTKIPIFPEKKENTTQIEDEKKLTQENIKSLQKFLSDSKDYHSDLALIYNRYIKYSDQIMTYTQCSESTIEFCTSNTNSKIRTMAVEKLKDSDLIKDLQTIAESIKSTNPQALNNSIESLKQAIEQAYLVKDNNNANSFKTIKDVGEAFISTINTAVTAYIDAFVTITSNFNSNNFIEAAQAFANAAKIFHKEVDIVAFSPIIMTLRGMVFQLNNSIEQTKQYTINLNDNHYTGGTTFANAINTLISAYKHATN
ncbi:hypothetical protein bcCo53_001749 (plasmid) [Borrelia coriaceae]|uniref:hypothetical protein n=1 Tax=Borrelia coriaceae TaxID=144 RepID=UPI0004834708|nr:hypothetical protein [Borrelia coriaceae]UPA17536.1 hypothetical protein bcCo53_001749 [Borrelia coriaceae]